MQHQIKKYIEDNTEIIELKNDLIVAKIAVNIGNMLFSLKKENTEILYFPFSFIEYKTNTKLAGIPFMHPWANRLEAEYIQVQNGIYHFIEESKKELYRDGNNLPLHGLLLKAEQWETIAIVEEANHCEHIAEYIFEDENLLSIFPFKHKIQIKHLLQNNMLTIKTILLNEDEKPMPVSFGYHPYFLKGEEKNILKVPADEVIEVDEIMIPTGNVFKKNKKWNFANDEISLENSTFDDGFQNLKFENDTATFKLNDIKILFDKNYLFAQIYAPKHEAKPYVCIEPMTASTNAINKNNCTFIKQNETYSAAFSIVL